MNHPEKLFDFYKNNMIGGIVRPDVILYEENLNMGVMDTAVSHIEKADMLIVGGTSLAVYPAAGLIDYYKGNKLVLINKSSTPYDQRANHVINPSEKCWMKLCNTKER